MQNDATAPGTDTAQGEQDAPVVLMDAAVSAYIAHIELKRLMALRDEFVGRSSHGRYCDKASAEWWGMPLNWRMLLLMVAGIGQDTDNLRTLAMRGWKEMPPPERDQLRVTVREAKRYIGRLVALAAKV